MIARGCPPLVNVNTGRLRLRPITAGREGDRNPFCGPAAISALTGLSTGAAARLLALQRRRAREDGGGDECGSIPSITGKSITGTSTAEMLRALQACGISSSAMNNSTAGRMTVRDWLLSSKHDRPLGVVFLLCVDKHWCLVEWNLFTCGATRRIVPLAAARVPLGKRLQECYRLTAPAGVLRPIV